jgi:hypothetical protein
MSLASRVAPVLPFVGTLFLGAWLFVQGPGSPQSETTPPAPAEASAPLSGHGTRQSVPPAVGRTEGAARRPELLAGWWPEETWPDGGTGHWTSEDASLRIERREGENDLLIDISFSHPTNLSTGFIEVNGRRLVRIRNANGRRRMILSVGSIPDRVLVVRFVAERPFIERVQGATKGDPRRLGFFVHEVRLLPAAE